MPLVGGIYAPAARTGSAVVGSHALALGIAEKRDAASRCPGAALALGGRQDSTDGGSQVNMGFFLNEFVVNLQVFLPLVVATALGLPIFGYFYNRLIDRLKEQEHTSIYVLMGTLVTLGAGALFSWKSALLFLILFGLDGLPMVFGEYRRTLRRTRSPRRKRLPYAANGLLDEAKMAGEEARRVLGRAIKGKGGKDDLIIVERELNTMMLRIIEIKQIQGRPQ